MGQAQHYGFAIYEEFAIHGVGVARGYAIPAVRKAAAVGVIGDFGADVEGAYEIAHGAYVGDGIRAFGFGGGHEFARAILFAHAYFFALRLAVALHRGAGSCARGDAEALI